MDHLSPGSGRTIREIYLDHADTLYRIAFTYLKNPYDSEDALQECFMRCLRSGKAFADAQHEKGWLIRTLVNICRDALRARARGAESVDDHPELAAAPAEGSLLDAVLALPDRYKAPLYLYYYEGYSVKEIAAMLRVPVNTVKTRLSRARKLLKNEWGDEPDEE